MQLSVLVDHADFSGERPMLGLSGGINSAALLCHLASEHPPEKRPQRLLLYYAHMREHSPDTFAFVADCVRYARRQRWSVTFDMHRASMNDWVRSNKMVPHPAVSPCTSDLKIEPMQRFAKEQSATCDLVGYVRHERRRIDKQQARAGTEGKRYPIAHLSDADCFSLVDREIGWHPAIYDLRWGGDAPKHRRGKRKFPSNNCLPCKNMRPHQRRAVREHFPEYAGRARAAAEAVGSYWGRDGANAGGDPCSFCAFD